MTQLRSVTGYSDPRDLGMTCSSYGEYEQVWRPVRPENNPFLLISNLPSTAYNQASNGYIRFTFMRENSTSAWATIVDTASDLLEEARTLSTVNLAHANANVFEIRRISGLGWGQLADMLKVDRRTVHNWIKGGRIRNRNRKRIADTLVTLRIIDKGFAQDNLVLLGEPSPTGPTVFELFKQEMYEEILELFASSGSARPALSKAERTGEYKAMTIHPGADGSETLEPLPFEPQPPGRKREIRRV